MTTVVLLCVMLAGPAVAIAAAWLVGPHDSRMAEAVFAAAGMWYVGLFGIAGIIYIFNTLTTISTYGK